MITIAGLVAKTGAFVKANPGKINAKLTYSTIVEALLILLLGGFLWALRSYI